MDNRHRDPKAFQLRQEREPCGSRVTRGEGARTQRAPETGKLDPYPDIRARGPGTVELPDTNKFPCVFG